MDVSRRRRRHEVRLAIKQGNAFVKTAFAIVVGLIGLKLLYGFQLTQALL